MSSLSHTFALLILLQLFVELVCGFTYVYRNGDHIRGYWNTPNADAEWPTQFSDESYEPFGSNQMRCDECQMGQSSAECDDGENNLENDWDESAVNYTCNSRIRYPNVKTNKIIEKCEYIPSEYRPKHKCMNDKLEYSTAHPTHGDHRPLWAVYGEYNFVPPQRWLHNVEHGAVVMLYHPCAKSALVSQLRTIVTSCIRKHIIAADTKVDTNSPLVLIAWGCKLSMNYVDENKVVSFIRRHALKGPEGTLAKDGEYKKQLIKRSNVPYGSDYEDSNICAQYATFQSTSTYCKRSGMGYYCIG